MRYRNEIVLHACSTYLPHVILLCIIIVLLTYISESIENARRFGRVSQLETTHHTRRRYYLIIFTLFYLPSCRNDLYLIRTHCTLVREYKCQRGRFVVTLGSLRLSQRDPKTTRMYIGIYS